LQRLAGNAAVGTLIRRGPNAERSKVLGVISSGHGRPLDGPARRLMETGFGADFGSVRVHTGPAATESAKSVDAHAYTVGEDVVFRDGLYRPDTEAGRRMLAHELAHVVQQRRGPVPGTPAPGGIRISDPRDPFEQDADRIARRVTAGPGAGPASRERDR
jgi:hypothetical protein